MDSQASRFMNKGATPAQRPSGVLRQASAPYQNVPRAQTHSLRRVDVRFTACRFRPSLPRVTFIRYCST